MKRLVLVTSLVASWLVFVAGAPIAAGNDHSAEMDPLVEDTILANDGGGGGVGRWDIVRRTDDRCGRWGLLRYGYYDRASDSGHNYDKMREKHNIWDTDVWSYVIRAPGCGQDGGGESRVYYAWTYQFKCTSYGYCWIAGEHRLKLVQEQGHSRQ